jgi:lipopolysaccharide biosynthesis regulator YciM
MNQAAHMATWARLDKDFAAARRWLSSLLSLNPRSSVAFAQLGQVAKAEGHCKEAIENWGKAIEILSTAFRV